MHGGRDDAGTGVAPEPIRVDIGGGGGVGEDAAEHDFDFASLKAENLSSKMSATGWGSSPPPSARNVLPVEFLGERIAGEDAGGAGEDAAEPDDDPVINLP